MIRAITVFVVLLAITGCTITKPNYSYNAAASDPVLVFRSDFEYHTLFSINIDPTSNNSCKKFMSVGYILNVETILIIGTPQNQEIQVRVPAGQPVAVKARYNFAAGSGATTCGPIYKSFTPEKGKTYLVRMVKDGNFCGVNISDRQNPSSPVQATILQGCN